MKKKQPLNYLEEEDLGWKIELLNIKDDQTVLVSMKVLNLQMIILRMISESLKVVFSSCTTRTIHWVGHQITYKNH
jgi:hypothetical protein